MAKVYVFPGQGSQKVGMGEGLFEKFPELTKQADEILGYSIAELCLTDAEGVINQTNYTQPALYVVSALSYLAKLEEGAEKPALTAGHSLGEYNALFAAGAFDFATGLKLVQKRGEIMAKIEGGGMAAVLGLSADQIKDIIASNNLDKIDVANFNAPTQTVLSGLKEDIVAAEEAFKAGGAKRYVVLPVSGAFHSRYMAEAQAEFTEFAKQFTFNELEIPVVANVTAEAYGAEILESLTAQISGSVRWVETIKNIVANDADAEFEEVGPGKVLSGLIRQINK